MKSFRSWYLTFTVLFFVFLSSGEWIQSHQKGPGQGQKTSVLGITILQERGKRVSWSPALDLIAFDKSGQDSYYDAYVIRPDGSGLKCLTEREGRNLPQKNNGQPEWHPTGVYIVFQVQDPALKGFPGKRPELESYLTSPCIGINNNF